MTKTLSTVALGLAIALAMSGARAQAPTMWANSIATEPILAPWDLVDLIVDSNSPDITYHANGITTDIELPSGNLTPSSPRSLGVFWNGQIPAGTPLPTANGGPTAVYAGGVGLSQGAVLSTGVTTDDEQPGLPPTGFGVGVQGPNNGPSGGTNTHLGEVSTSVLGQQIIDVDLGRALTPIVDLELDAPFSGDPTVLQFRIILSKPGFVRVKTVFGSDEFPAFINQEFNDSFAILIKRTGADSSEYENIAILNKSTGPVPFNLQDEHNCGPLHFLANQVPTTPSSLPPSDHSIKDGNGAFDPSVPKYDHEFGGFTTPRTWETAQALAPGDYTIKFVIQDVADDLVDSALFVEDDSLTSYAFLAADFSMDGNVNGRDFLIWQRNGGGPGRTFAQGDATGDGYVNGADLTVWQNTFGQSGGHVNWRADFNRDGAVNAADDAILQAHFGMVECASRFDGDADGDGDVDNDDEAIWLDESTP